MGFFLFFVTDDGKFFSLTNALLSVLELFGLFFTLNIIIAFIFCIMTESK